MIRPATLDDIPRILELGVIMHASTDYASLDYHQERAGQFMADLIGGQGVVFLAEIDGTVVGGMAGAIGQRWFNADLFAYEIALFLDPSRRHGITAAKLVRAFIHWSRAQGAKQIEVGITTGRDVEAITLFYRSLGFKSELPMFKLEI